jgi:hypothetical protein
VCATVWSTAARGEAHCTRKISTVFMYLSHTAAEGCRGGHVCDHQRAFTPTVPPVRVARLLKMLPLPLLPERSAETDAHGLRLESNRRFQNVNTLPFQITVAL